jgi:hypothetical protein
MTSVAARARLEALRGVHSEPSEPLGGVRDTALGAAEMRAAESRRSDRLVDDAYAAAFVAAAPPLLPDIPSFADDAELAASVEAGITGVAVRSDSSTTIFRVHASPDAAKSCCSLLGSTPAPFVWTGLTACDCARTTNSIRQLWRVLWIVSR